MDCPRCASTLDRYEFRDRVAYGCDRCGYVGVPVEHRSELRPVESWADAIRRFNEKGRRVDGEEDGSVPLDAVKRAAAEITGEETSAETNSDDSEDTKDTDVSGVRDDTEEANDTDPTPAIRWVPEPAIRRVEE
ncbi:hypothetical protein [Natronomonas sp. EA1]|uniref:hypothetical protein n=1 Tax=Natronomonas sp. EA1 TaxID=3421655 RepID=UPI003EC0BF91